MAEPVVLTVAEAARRAGVPRGVIVHAHAPLLLTVPETAVALRLGRNTIYSLIQRGELPVVRVGRSIRISAAALDRWIAEHSEAVPS